MLHYTYLQLKRLLKLIDCGGWGELQQELHT